MTRWTLGLGALIALAVGACGGSNQQNQTAGPTASTAAFVGVSPAEGASGVAVSSPISLRFNTAMATGMEQYMDLHVGDLSGPTVPMNCGWSGDREVLTCTPLSPLMPHTTYAIHMGGRMMSASGMMIDYSQAQAMGGQWIMGGMMGGSHDGMGWGMMGSGWQNPNGSYGMMFTFTTA